MLIRSASFPNGRKTCQQNVKSHDIGNSDVQPSPLESSFDCPFRSEIGGDYDQSLSEANGQCASACSVILYDYHLFSSVVNWSVILVISLPVLFCHQALAPNDSDVSMFVVQAFL